MLTLIDGVDTPVLHNNAPVAVVESVEVPSQLFTTLIVGVDGSGATVNIPLAYSMV